VFVRRGVPLLVRFEADPLALQRRQVNFIEKGNYGGVSLDGLAIATMGQNPDGTTMMESFGKWDFANIYIDEKANPQQRRALEAIAKATLPLGAPPERTRIQYLPITRNTEGSEHTITAYRGERPETG
jgi:hypothetical protein